VRVGQHGAGIRDALLSDPEEVSERWPKALLIRTLFIPIVFLLQYVNECYLEIAG
jgi:hypothetical protein